MKPPPQPKNDYPTSDGRPFDSDWHREALCGLIDSFRTWFADAPDVYASGFLLLFYEKGNPRSFIAPDVFVTFGACKYDRDNYLLWEEPPPAIVIELTSAKTRREDLHKKMRLYRDVIGVKEYVLFDPREEYLEPSLQGYRLLKGKYRPTRLRDGRLYSRQLGLWLERDRHFLRPVARSKRLQPLEEIKRTREAERQRAEAERERADALAEALRLAQLELKALRRQMGKPEA